MVENRNHIGLLKKVEEDWCLRLIWYVVLVPLEIIGMVAKTEIPVEHQQRK